MKLIDQKINLPNKNIFFQIMKFFKINLQIRYFKLNLKFFSLFLTSILTFYNIPVLSNDPKSQDNQPTLDYLNKLPSDKYILGKGDKLNIIISNDLPELNSIKVIDINGTIFLPQVKRIYIDGLTISELIKLLNKRYKEFLVNPEVEVEILKYRPINIFVSGEINNPGLYVLKGENNSIEDNPLRFESNPNNLSTENQFFPTLFEALKKAGGITRNADLSEVKIYRKLSISNGGGQEEIKLNFLDLLDKGKVSANIRLYDQDYIVIKKSKTTSLSQISKAIKSNLNPKFISVAVVGQVQDPGIIKVNKSSTLNDALLISGGKKVLSGNITFLRYQNDGEIITNTFKFNPKSKRGSKKNPYLEQGDVIKVNRGNLSTAAEVVDIVNKPFVGIYSTYGLFKLLND